HFLSQQPVGNNSVYVSDVGNTVYLCADVIIQGSLTVDAVEYRQEFSTPQWTRFLSPKAGSSSYVAAITTGQFSTYYVRAHSTDGHTCPQADSNPTVQVMLQTATPTPSATPTGTPSASPTAPFTPTGTVTSSGTPTGTVTATGTPSASPTVSPTPDDTPD